MVVALRHEDETTSATRKRRERRPERRPWVRLHADATAPLPLVRKGMLPEHAGYADTGCDLFASCLRCPLARCRYDDAPGGLRRLMTDARDREIAAARRRERTPINTLAAHYGLTRRSIFRILSEQRRTGK